MSELIDDYLDFNPTRNRALDLLPLFMHIDKDRLRKVVDDPRVKPRPTFHYRLPNSDVGNPDWTIFSAWSDWLVVEWLANSDSKLEALCELYEAHLGQLFGNIRTNWTKETEEWLATNR